MSNSSLVLLWVGGILLGIAIGSYIQRTSKETDFIRDCSITGAHVLDNETVVVCKVVKVRTQEVPSPTNTKPEVTL